MRRLFERFPVGLICLGWLLCFAPLLLLRDFSSANELRYLSIADEALAQGHFFAFFNHGIPYADKPPLYFWIIMGCRLLLGKHSMPFLCFFSVLPAFGIAAVTDRWLLRGESPLRRAAAAMMLLTTALFLGMAVYVRMDMLMCFWIVLALHAFDRVRSGWFGFLTFLALFTKGPVGLLVPPLGALAYLLASGRAREIGKRFNGAFWLCLVLPSLAWLGGVWLEGGRDYFLNLTVHQTVGRAVHSFHHQAPFWFYFAVIWGVAAPWCLLTVPGTASSLLNRIGRSEGERLQAWTALVTFVVLSLFSSKLGLYLLPIVPFLTGAFVLAEKRLGWRPWMRGMLGAISLLLALCALAALCGWFGFDRLGVPSDYAFIHTPLLLVAGVLLLAAGIYAFCASRRGWERPVLALGAALLLSIAVGSPAVMPRVNELSGYGPLCADIRAQGEPAGEVWTSGLSRPENMDVYLHRPIHILDPEAFLEDPGILPEGALVVVAQKQDAAASGRYSDVLQSTGRSASESSGGRYRIWR